MWPVLTSFPVNIKEFITNFEIAQLRSTKMYLLGHFTSTDPVAVCRAQCIGNFRLRHGEACTLVQKSQRLDLTESDSPVSYAVVLRGVTFWHFLFCPLS